jgi:hypothetical protein
MPRRTPDGLFPTLLDNWLTTSLRIPLLKLADDLLDQMTELDAGFVMRSTPLRNHLLMGRCSTLDAYINP